MVTTDDYMWLYETLKPRNNVTFMELDEGHMGILLPADTSIIDLYLQDILDVYYHETGVKIEKGAKV